MKAISAVFVVGVAIFTVGCGKSWSPSHTGTAPAKVHSASHTSASEQMDEAQRTIELQAQRAKHDIDQITVEAEQALHDASSKATSTAKQAAAAAKQHAAQLQEFSSELAEDAKDRAEDVPEAVDEEVSNKLNQFKTRLHRAAEEATSPENSVSRRRVVGKLRQMDRPDQRSQWRAGPAFFVESPGGELLGE